MKNYFLPLALVVMVSVAIPAFAKEKLPSEAVAAIEHTLTKYYGNNNQNGCLLFEYADKGEEKSSYCVRVVQSELKTLNNQSQLYVLVSGDYAEEGAGHPTPGIGGLFIFNQNNNQWKLVASEPYIVNGAFGGSQLENFKLVKIAPDKFGWFGDFGYTSTGCTESTKYIYAQVGNKVEPIFEADPLDTDCSGNSDGWDSYESKLTILNQKPAVNGFYPLQINAVQHDYPANHNIKKGKVKKYTYQMTYKPTAQKYTQ